MEGPEKPTRGRGSVFRYHDGSHVIGADPLRVRDALDRAMPGWAAAADELFAIEKSEAQFAEAGMDVGEKLRQESEEKRSRLIHDLVKAARHAFTLALYREVDGVEEGLTDLEVLDVLADYLSWVSDLMEDTRP